MGNPPPVAVCPPAIHPGEAAGADNTLLSVASTSADFPSTGSPAKLGVRALVGLARLTSLAATTIGVSGFPASLWMWL
jgi:hypothetical protein